MSDSRQKMKVAAARAALSFVDRSMVVGIGTGSTAEHFIAALPDVRERVEACVASSVASARLLSELGFHVVGLETVGRVPLYVDGADEATREGRLIKGGGGALTREKIVAAASDCFVCIIDDSKLVERVGAYPLPLEVVPMARGHVTAVIWKMGGRVEIRDGFTTDNGNCILDAHGLDMDDPVAVESALNQIAGVVSNGLFCARGADVLLVGSERGVERIDTR